MAKIKDAIERGKYKLVPVTKVSQNKVHPTEDQMRDFFVNDEEIAKFHKEREFKKQMEVDKTDDWYDTWVLPNQY